MSEWRRSWTAPPWTTGWKPSGTVAFPNWALQTALYSQVEPVFQRIYLFRRARSLGLRANFSTDASTHRKSNRIAREVFS